MRLYRTLTRQTVPSGFPDADADGMNDAYGVGLLGTQDQAQAVVGEVGPEPGNPDDFLLLFSSFLLSRHTRIYSLEAAQAKDSQKHATQPEEPKGPVRCSEEEV